MALSILPSHFAEVAMVSLSLTFGRRTLYLQPTLTHHVLSITVSPKVAY